MIGGTVGEVVASKNPAFKPGDKVVGHGRLAAVRGGRRATSAACCARSTPTHMPLSAYLGARRHARRHRAGTGSTRSSTPKAGETVVVSAASGAVGGVVGQLAKVRGCRAVGIAGGPEKCRYVVEELGFDACIDYKQHPDLKSLAQALKEACPNGIDGHFENVGGVILDAVMLRIERVRPHRAVRHDRRLQRRADPDGRARS